MYSYISALIGESYNDRLGIHGTTVYTRGSMQSSIKQEAEPSTNIVKQWQTT